MWKTLLVFLALAWARSSFAITWEKDNWAFGCDFPAQDLENIQIRGEDCGGRCWSNPKCTHFAWNKYKGGTCWLKKGSCSKKSAIDKGNDQNIVCGVTRCSGGGGGGGSGGSPPSPPTSAQEEIVNYHNLVRSQVSPPAADMKTMTWDTRAAETAQRYSSGCNFKHSSSKSRPGLGENLAADTSAMSWSKAMKMWADEKATYQYPTGASNHYTQMVWSDSTGVGCGYSRCPAGSNPMGAKWGQWNFYVCNYSPLGNWVGKPPYRKA